MNFSVDRQALIDSLKLVGQAVSTRSSLPVLSNVLMQVTNDVRLWASNLELVMSAVVTAEVKKAGAITLPYRAMLNLLAEMSADEVHFALGAGSEVTITGDGTEVRLSGIDADEFPATETALTENVTRISFEPGELDRSWGSVAFAAASEDARPTLTGMLVQIAGGKMQMVATDGFRLAWREDPVIIDGEVNALVPARTIKPMLALVKGLPATVQFNCNELMIEAEGRLAKVQLVGGNYPDYEAIVPADFQTTVQMDRKGLATSLALMVEMCKLSTSSNPVVTMAWEGSEETEAAWLLGAAANGTGKATAVCRPVALTGKVPQRMGFNANYVADALANCPGDQVALMMNGPVSPMLVRPLTGADWNCLIMPQGLI